MAGNLIEKSFTRLLDIGAGFGYRFNSQFFGE